MFIIFGILTSIWSILLFFFLPDTINDANFLTEEEKQYAEDRVVMGGTGRVDTLNSRWKREQVIECLLDPKTYFFAAISVLTQIPNGGTGSFANLALKSFGFTSLESTLVSLPASVISMTTIIATGWLASRFRNTTTLLIIAVVIPPVVGSALIFSVKSRGVRLFAYYCVSNSHFLSSFPFILVELTFGKLQTGPSGIPLTLGLLSANFKGVTKKMTITAILFVTYCAGNISGPQTFKSSEAKRYEPSISFDCQPRFCSAKVHHSLLEVINAEISFSGYPTAFKAILVCYGLVIIVSICLRFYLTFVNKSRDESEGVTTVQDTSTKIKELTAADYEDTTDFNTIGFRYRL